MDGRKILHQASLPVKEGKHLHPEQLQGKTHHKTESCHRPINRLKCRRPQKQQPAYDWIAAYRCSHRWWQGDEFHLCVVVYLSIAKAIPLLSLCSTLTTILRPGALKCSQGCISTTPLTGPTPQVLADEKASSSTVNVLEALERAQVWGPYSILTFCILVVDHLFFSVKILGQNLYKWMESIYFQRSDRSLF